ncbi:6422_t:CDS:2, partial [Entrophospora sp. SA101]
GIRRSARPIKRPDLNRSWCKIGIPILWSSIFYSIQTTLSYKVITIYLKCLKKEKKLQLIKEGIRLEDEE